MTESFLARHFHATAPQRGLEPTFTAALDDCWEGRNRMQSSALPGRKPAVQIIPEPFPSARVWRGLGGAGRIVLSQGLVDMIDEADLRAVIRQGVARIGSAAIPGATFCAAVDTQLRRRLFSRIQDGVNPLQALLCWMLLPWTRFLDRQTRRLDILNQAPESLLPMLRSIDRFRKIHGRNRDRLDWLS